MACSGKVRVGCAGWSIPAASAAEFPGEGTHLERYARRLCVAEINSSFYRPHRPSTYARWAASTPPGFLFSVKVPKEITHTRKLQDPEEPLDRFLAEMSALGDRLGPLLVQLPPRLALDTTHAAAFFQALRARFSGAVVCEPRHPTWFEEEGEQLLQRYEIARVAADPAPVPAAAEPGGWDGLVYYRLHGSPRIYYSRYPEEFLEALAGRMRDRDAWCIFDNTAAGEATGNALDLQSRLTVGDAPSGRNNPSPE